MLKKLVAAGFMPACFGFGRMVGRRAPIGVVVSAVGALRPHSLVHLADLAFENIHQVVKSKLDFLMVKRIG